MRGIVCGDAGVDGDTHVSKRLHVSAAEEADRHQNVLREMVQLRVFPVALLYRHTSNCLCVLGGLRERLDVPERPYLRR